MEVVVLLSVIAEVAVIFANFLDYACAVDSLLSVGFLLYHHRFEEMLQREGAVVLEEVDLAQVLGTLPILLGGFAFF